MESYFVKLMINERSDRAGFPPDVAAEIVHLSLIHADQYRKNAKDDVWSPEARVYSDFGPLASARNLTAWPAIPSATALEIQALDVSSDQEGFFRAAATGNIRAIRLLLESGVHLETRNEEGWTILMSTAYNGQTS